MPRTWDSGLSGVTHSPTGCCAIFRISAAFSSSPSSVYAATWRAALPSGLTQYGSLSLGCCSTVGALFLSPPSPWPEQPASSRAAPSAAAVPVVRRPATRLRVRDRPV